MALLKSSLLLKPSLTLVARSSKQTFVTKIGIVGVPFGFGQKKNGPYMEGLQKAPDIIRGAILEDFKASGMDFKDYGQVTYCPLESTSPGTEHLLNYEHVVPNTREVSKLVSEVIEDGRQCLVLGGDHSTFLGSAHGHLEAKGEDNVAVIYVDAHADINTSSSTTSGKMHGMPVSGVVRELAHHWQDLPNLEWLTHRMPLSSIGFIGLREVEPFEVDLFSERNVAAYDMFDVVEKGISRVLTEVLERVDPEGRKFIHLSIDADSLDPLEAPSTTCPVRGGLLLRELLYIVEKIRRTGRLSLIDFVEFNPLLGTAEDQKRTLEATQRVILQCFGLTYSKNTIIS